MNDVVEFMTSTSIGDATPVIVLSATKDFWADSPRDVRFIAKADATVGDDDEPTFQIAGRKDTLFNADGLEHVLQIANGEDNYTVSFITSSVGIDALSAMHEENNTPLDELRTQLSILAFYSPGNLFVQMEDQAEADDDVPRIEELPDGLPDGPQQGNTDDTVSSQEQVVPTPIQPTLVQPPPPEQPAPEAPVQILQPQPAPEAPVQPAQPAQPVQAPAEAIPAPAPAVAVALAPKQASVAIPSPSGTVMQIPVEYLQMQRLQMAQLQQQQQQQLALLKKQYEEQPRENATASSTTATTTTTPVKDTISVLGYEVPTSALLLGGTLGLGACLFGLYHFTRSSSPSSAAAEFIPPPSSVAPLPTSVHRTPTTPSMMAKLTTHATRTNTL